MEDIKEVALPEELKSAIRDYRTCSTRELKAHMEMIERMWADSISSPLAELQKDAEPVSYEYQDREGNWKPFIDQRHYENTVKDGSWPIRALYTHPQPKAATVPQGWVAHVSVIEGAFVQPSRHVPDGTYSLVVKDAAPSLPAQSTKAEWALKQIAYLDPKTGSIGTAVLMAREAIAKPTKFRIGDPVRKVKGSQWHGYVVGTYSTELTQEGYAVESETERGSVQIYPAAALELWEPAQSEGEQK